MNFFRNENDCGCYAYSENNELEQECVVFNMGSGNSEIKVSKDLVITVEQAYTAAIDFFNTYEMSNKMKWFEL